MPSRPGLPTLELDRETNERQRGFAAEDSDYARDPDQDLPTFRLVREVNPHCSEYLDLRDYIDKLADANNATELPDNKGWRLGGARVLSPGAVHITSIGASDARDLLILPYWRGSELPDKRKVAKIRDIANRFKEHKLRRHAVVIERIAYAAGATAISNGRRWEPRQAMPDADEFAGTNGVTAAILSGIFRLDGALSAVGDGYQFAVMFEEEEDRFLRRERESDMNFLVRAFKISKPDKEARDRIMDNTPHAVLAMKGEQCTERDRIAHPTYLDGVGSETIEPPPETLVTGFHPRARIDYSRKDGTDKRSN
jgi:hypothetical protein